MSTPPTTTRAFELPQLEATEIIPAPQPDAPQIDLQAEAEAARARGHEQGFAAGLEEGRAQLQSAVVALAAAVQAVEDERDRVAAGVEDAAVELAVRIAEQVLAGALDVRPELVLEVVRGALRRLVERDRVTILVNPEDLDLVRDGVPAVIAELGGIEHCEVQAERRVGRGGAVVRTVEGEVDASLATKLARVREVVADERR